MTVRLSEAIKSDAPVGGDRCAGDIDGAEITAARIVVSHDDLVGVIRVSPSECLRLRNVGRSLGVVDQVHIRAAVCQGSWHETVDKLGQGSGRRGFTSFCQTAENHDGARPKVFHPVDAQLVNLGTVKSRRNQRVHGLRAKIPGGEVVLLLRLCRENARAQQRQEHAGKDHAEAD